MNLILILYTVLLFVALTPGVLLTLPKGGSKLTVAAVHALIFAVVYYFTAKTVLDLSMKFEGFAENKTARKKKAEENAKKVTELPMI